jgi:hypothetical protein
MPQTAPVHRGRLKLVDPALVPAGPLRDALEEYAELVARELGCRFALRDLRDMDALDGAIPSAEARLEDISEAADQSGIRLAEAVAVHAHELTPEILSALVDVGAQ